MKVGQRPSGLGTVIGGKVVQKLQLRRGKRKERINLPKQKQDRASVVSQNQDNFRYLQQRVYNQVNKGN